MNPRPAPAAEGSGPRREPDLSHVVRRAQLGSHAAFEELVLAYAGRLHRFLVLRLGGESEARDVRQETFLAAWRGLPRLQDPARFWVWLAGIAAHKAADERRRRLPAPLDDADRQPALDADVLEIREALGRLPEPMREVLLLRYVLRLSEEETAAALGVRVGTVKSRAARARRALLEALR